MKILLVAMSDSIHTVRWVKQFVAMGWDVRVFPSIDHGIVHPGMSCIPVYHTLGGQLGSMDWKLYWQRQKFCKAIRRSLGLKLFPKLSPQRRARQLLRVIDEFQPDIVHSLEFQAAGYLTAEVKKEKGRGFPPWIATNWGSDLYYFRQFPDHEQKIREVLALCDYYSCECRRDVCLAVGLGLNGHVLPVIPNAGGFDLQMVTALRQPGPVSSRRIVILKGYQHWVGRALVGLAALEECAELLRNYELVIHSASPETQAAALTFQSRTGVKMTLLPKGLPHDQILGMYGRARIALGLSLSDGISTSFLEALAMGAFPVQSWTSCADEWIEDGISGLLVPPEDVVAVAAALRRALTDDNLVNQADVINSTTTRRRLDQNQIRALAIDFYNTIACECGIPCI